MTAIRMVRASLSIAKHLGPENLRLFKHWYRWARLTTGADPKLACFWALSGLDAEELLGEATQPVRP